MKPQDLGKKGEDIAIDFLNQKGYIILEKNYRYQKREIDIIAQKGKWLIAVEVKTRSTAEFGNPQDFVKPKQIQGLVAAMDHYVTTNPIEAEIRFDIIAIIKNKAGTRVEHIPNAFYHF